MITGARIELSSTPLANDARFRKPYPRLTQKLRKIIDHIGYVMDRSGADKFENGVDHLVISTA